MRVSKLFSFALAFALLFSAFVFASPPNLSAKSAVSSEKTVINGSVVVAVNFDAAKAVAPERADERRQFINRAAGRPTG